MVDKLRILSLKTSQTHVAVRLVGAGIAGCLASLGLTAVCSGERLPDLVAENSIVAAPPADASSSATDDPYGDLFKYDMAQVWRVVELRRWEPTIACFAERGFTPQLLTRYAPDGPTAKDSLSPLRLVSNYISRIEQGALMPRSAITPVRELNHEENIAFDECQRDAEVSYPNPNAIFFMLIEDVELEISARVQSDERSISAAQIAAECYAATGLTHAGDPWDQLEERASMIVEAYINGAVSRSEAIGSLSALVPLEDALVACDDGIAEVRAAVAAQVWSEWAADHPEIATEFTTVVAESMTLYDIPDE